MKLFSILLLVGFFLGGCAVKTTYVEIMSPVKAFQGGKVSFTATAGDTFKVLGTKPCKGGYGTCWHVKNIKTGETGFVRKKDMEDAHRVYVEEKDTQEKNEKVPTPSHIEILQSGKVFYDEEYQYDVAKGDMLNVVKADYCNSEDLNEICWIVEHATTGKRGKVNAKKMEDLHRIIYPKKQE